MVGHTEQQIHNMQNVQTFVFEEQILQSGHFREVQFVVSAQSTVHLSKGTCVTPF